MTQPLTSVSETLLAGRYRLGRQIGYGGMGRVYEAQDERLDRPVAVKLIAAAPGVDDELEREARAAARLTHPGIVRVFDAGMWPGGGFIVMELVSGGSLKHLLLERRTLPMAEALPLVAELADALEHAHRQGVVHCDVKPHNILITSEGQPKLVDFGIARAVTISGTRTQDEIQGSAPYLAPEQVSGGKIDGRTDVYALGAVLYEMLTGEPPFQGHSLAAVISQRLASDPPPPSQLDPAIPPAVDEALLRALARDPDERFQTAAELRDALRRLADGVPSGSTETVRILRRPASGYRARVRKENGAGLPGTAGLGPGWPRRLRPFDVRLIPLAAGVVLLLVVLALALGARRGSAPAVAVPDVAGKRMSQVPALLEQSRLQVGDVSTSGVDLGRVGVVVAQRPGAGQPLPPGGKVDLVIGIAG
ncbi:MAG TPA: serine/threonine-protein kinase [Chloroflexota bacterium]|nr:serine/threonine-protein kinase [Chloroflexota bacterium]